MHKGIFITGTDTGVGKTFVACGLLKALREMGYKVCPMKPVETGCRVKKGKPDCPAYSTSRLRPVEGRPAGRRQAGLVPEDTINLIKASGVKEPIDIINPYRFRPPLAPSVAAELEDIIIKKKKILSTYKYLSNKYDITIIEGAGGLMVPVYKKYLFLDLIKDLTLPIIIVSRPGLGTINHTLLTIEAARSRGIKIIGVIINHSTKIKKGLAEKTNPEIIEKLGGVPVLGIIPYSKNPESSSVRRSFLNIFKKIWY